MEILSNEAEGIGSVERETIYEAMSIIGIDREATDAYLFLLTEGESPVERIPLAPHRKMRILQLLVSKNLVAASRGGMYTARDAEYVLRSSVDQFQRNARLLEKAINELELAGRGNKARSLTSSDQFYAWETRLIQRTAKEIYGVTVRFKILWLMRKELGKQISSKGISVRVMGDISNPTTYQRAVDLEDEGVEVRHSPAVSEMLRFILFDDTSVLFGFRNPEDPSRHLGAWIRAPEFVEPLKYQFEAKWNKAEPSEVWRNFDFAK